MFVNLRQLWTISQVQDKQPADCSCWLIFKTKISTWCVVLLFMVRSHLPRSVQQDHICHRSSCSLVNGYRLLGLSATLQYANLRTQIDVFHQSQGFQFWSWQRIQRVLLYMECKILATRKHDINTTFFIQLIFIWTNFTTFQNFCLKMDAAESLRPCAWLAPQSP